MRKQDIKAGEHYAASFTGSGQYDRRRAIRVEVVDATVAKRSRDQLSRKIEGVLVRVVEIPSGGSAFGYKPGDEAPMPTRNIFERWDTFAVGMAALREQEKKRANEAHRRRGVASDAEARLRAAGIAASVTAYTSSFAVTITEGQLAAMLAAVEAS